MSMEFFLVETGPRPETVQDIQMRNDMTLLRESLPLHPGCMKTWGFREPLLTSLFLAGGHSGSS